jgi:hypothetical protein
MKPNNTRNGCERFTGTALSVGDLSDEDMAAIAAAEVPAEYAHLDEEQPRRLNLCHDRPPVEHHPRDARQMCGNIWIAEHVDAPDPGIDNLFQEGDEA